VDDSIVRGTTMGPLVNLVREAGGAAEVHVRVASPPVRHPCFMGVDLASYDQLIASSMEVEAIRAHVGADSLAYLSVEGMHAAVREGMPAGSGHCDACFSGSYPVDVSALQRDADAKNRFEAGSHASEEG
jgi:amidophosphoribosyltransferase